MRFLFDVNISYRLARAISILAEPQRHEIVHHSEKFGDDSLPDTEWIRALSREPDWVIITADVHIWRGAAERIAWRESGLTAFFFESGFAGLLPWKQAAELCLWWPTIVQTARESPRGTGYRLPRKGEDPKVLYPPRGES